MDSWQTSSVLSRRSPVLHHAAIGDRNSHEALLPPHPPPPNNNWRPQWIYFLQTVWSVSFQVLKVGAIVNDWFVVRCRQGRCIVGSWIIKLQSEQLLFLIAAVGRWLFIQEMSIKEFFLSIKVFSECLQCENTFFFPSPSGTNTFLTVSLCFWSKQI